MKTTFKISLFLIYLGWFAFMFLSAWGTAQDWEIRITICLSAFAICIFGAFTFTTLLNNKGFWMLNDELNKIDSRLGKTLYVKNAKIKPDGGIIEVEDDKGKWRIILVVEAKHQGKDVENIQAGKKVGKNNDQDLMVAGNAIERVHKNINEMRNIMIKENHFPYVVFLQGSNFSTKTLDVLAPDGRCVKIKPDSGEMNRIDRVTAANYSMSINQNHCENIFIKKNGSYMMLQATSIYARCEPWEEEEMIEIMMQVAETSLSILSKQLSEN